MPLAAFPKCYLEALAGGRMTLEQWVDIAVERLDVDGLELYWPHLASSSPAELEALRARAERGGLSIPMLCASPDFTHPDRDRREQELASQRRAIQAGAVLGVRYCRVLSGQRWPGVGREAGLQLAAGAIESLLELARAHDVVLVLENHFKDGHWAHPEFAQAPDVFFDLLERLPRHDAFGVNYDPSNALVAGADPVAFLRRVLPRVVSMHASDRYVDTDPDGSTRLEHGIVGEGQIAYDEIFALLARAGFAGWISIEDGNDPAVGVEHLAASAAYLRAKMGEHALP